MFGRFDGFLEHIAGGFERSKSKYSRMPAGFELWFRGSVFDEKLSE